MLTFPLLSLFILYIEVMFFCRFNVSILLCTECTHIANPLVKQDVHQAFNCSMQITNNSKFGAFKCVLFD